MYAAIDGGEVEALVYDLKQRDLSSFDIRSRPESSELLMQKIESLPHFERFWFNCLWDGETCNVSSYYKVLQKQDWRLGGFWPTKEILESYLATAKTAERYQSVTSKNISDTLEKICQSAKRERKCESGSRSWGYDLPPIQVARIEFENYLGGSKLSWPELNDQDGQLSPTSQAVR